MGGSSGFIRAGIDQQRKVSLVGQENDSRIRTVVQFIAKILRGQSLGDLFLSSRLPFRTDLQALRFALRADPNRIPFSPGAAAGNFSILFGNDQFEFFLFLLLFFRLLLFDRTQDDLGKSTSARAIL